MQIAGLNALDLLLIFITLIGAGIGVTQGVLSQLLTLVSIWLGLVVTLWLYKPFSINILQGLGLPVIGSDTMAFFILLLIFVNALNLGVKALSTPPEERKMKKKSEDDPLAEAAKSATQRFVIGPLNMLGGAVMGFVLTTLWIAIVIGVMQFIFQPALVSPGGGAGSGSMVTNLSTSRLVPLYNQVLLVLVQSVNWFTPKNADILRKIFEK
jgi:hypothetical protein